MLTHTIRALTLLVLVAIAHTLRPFSLNNVTAFALGTTTSVASLLPTQTLERWQDFSTLAALVTGTSNLFTSRLNFADQAVVARLGKVEQVSTGKPTSAPSQVNPSIRHSQSIASLQRRRFNNTRVPRPIIPDLESNLVANPGLMTLPSVGVTEAIELPAYPVESSETFEAFGFQQQFNSFGQPKENTPEESSWFLETVVQKPVPFSNPNMTWKLIAPVHRIYRNGLACPQPARNTKGLMTTKGQSC